MSLGTVQTASGSLIGITGLMFAEASSLLSLAGAIFGMLGLVGGAVAYLAAMRQRTTIAVLETDNSALRNRVSTIEGLERDCQMRLAKAETSVKVLTDTVTNAQAVAELLARVDIQHADIKALSATVERHFALILKLLDKKAEA